ncbi:xylulose 5-phosphate/phosphate translocator, chloroplastic [Canna indica]|uniref:Xylulose 5-phosphate/phosphate translocator, chloroplastic n=1 Tax=Canna indica TaxID=4628 RepID=A0AAQ3Q553_9LILI|nr:xylulose 5-phosphate/phosphate translocator, chloroplastic [Canna indica]
MVSSLQALLLPPPPPFSTSPSSSSVSPPRRLLPNCAAIFRTRANLQQAPNPCALPAKTTLSSSCFFLRRSLLRRISAGLITVTPAAASSGAAAVPDPDGDPDAPPSQDLQVGGSEVADADGKKKKSGDPRLRLAIVFGFWYFQNVVFNIYNKKVLNVFPYPWLLASFQLLAGSLWMAALWLSGIQPFPRPLGRRFFLALLGPALFHTIGHISACVSFSKVAVSFTHVIKSSEPVFSVVFSALLGVKLYPLPVWLSVLPIVAGCSLAAVTEVSFDAQGLWGALISNVGFVLRNIYSKKSLQDFSHVDGLNLYGWISIISLLYLFPVAVFVEGSQWAAGFGRALAAVPTPWTFYLWVLVSGIFYHLYNQSSYQALDEISPLTFSVGNTMKRVVVIVASVIAFRNPVRPLNALGSAIAIFGTFLYSQATALGNKNGKNTPEKKSN